MTVKTSNGLRSTKFIAIYTQYIIILLCIKSVQLVSWKTQLFSCNIWRQRSLILKYQSAFYSWNVDSNNKVILKLAVDRKKNFNKNFKDFLNYSLFYEWCKFKCWTCRLIHWMTESESHNASVGHKTFIPSNRVWFNHGFRKLQWNKRMFDFRNLQSNNFVSWNLCPRICNRYLN